MNVLSRPFVAIAGASAIALAAGAYWVAQNSTVIPANHCGVVFGDDDQPLDVLLEGRHFFRGGNKIRIINCERQLFRHTFYATFEGAPLLFVSLVLRHSPEMWAIKQYAKQYASRDQIEKCIVNYCRLCLESQLETAQSQTVESLTQACIRSVKVMLPSVNIEFEQFSITGKIPHLDDNVNDTGTESNDNFINAFNNFDPAGDGSGVDYVDSQGITDADLIDRRLLEMRNERQESRCASQDKRQYSDDDETKSSDSFSDEYWDRTWEVASSLCPSDFDSEYDFRVYNPSSYLDHFAEHPFECKQRNCEVCLHENRQYLP